MDFLIAIKVHQQFVLLIIWLDFRIWLRFKFLFPCASWSGNWSCCDSISCGYGNFWSGRNVQ